MDKPDFNINYFNLFMKKSIKGENKNYALIFTPLARLIINIPLSIKWNVQ